MKATHFCKKSVYIVVRMKIVRNCRVSLGLNMAIWQEVASAGCGVSFRGVLSYRSASVRNARPAKRRWRRGMDAESDVILVRQLSKLCDVTARAAHTVRVHTTHGRGQPLVQYVRVVRSRAVVIVAFRPRSSALCTHAASSARQVRLGPAAWLRSLRIRSARYWSLPVLFDCFNVYKQPAASICSLLFLIRLSNYKPFG